MMRFKKKLRKWKNQMTKLIVIITAFAGAFLLALIASEKGIFENKTVLTLDNGFQFTTVFLIAIGVALLATRLRSPN